jgi:hypothetical protein
MAQIIRVKPGAITAQDGTYPELRGTRKGAVGTQDIGGRFEELLLRGNVYAAQIANANPTGVSTGILGAAGTPLLLVWNPANSGKIFSILQASVAIRNNGTVSPGSFVWTGGLTTAVTANLSQPLNLFTLQASGSSGKFVANAAATGLSALNYIRPIFGIGAATTATTTGFPQGYEDVSGSLFIPPGAAMGIISTVTGTAAVVDAGIVWEELPYAG